MKLGLTPWAPWPMNICRPAGLGPRLRDSQVFGFEYWAKIPGRPGHCAVGRIRHERLPARLRPVFLQAVRWRTPRQWRPLAWGERLLEHYRTNRVDPLTKTLIFSDGLTIARIIELYNQFRGTLPAGVGIGTNSPTTWATHLPTSRCRSSKMTRCNASRGLSDTPARACAMTKMPAYLRQVFDILHPSEKNPSETLFCPQRNAPGAETT